MKEDELETLALFGFRSGFGQYDTKGGEGQ